MFESQRQLTDGVSGEMLAAARNASPPVAVSGLVLGGVSLQDWVFILTIVYLLAQTAYLGWKWWRERSNG